MKAKSEDSAFICNDCGREEAADYAGEAAFPRACRVCGGDNFAAVNGHKPSGTGAVEGATVEVGADDQLETSIQ